MAWPGNCETERDQEVRDRIRVGSIVVLAPRVDFESAYEVVRIGPKMIFLRAWCGSGEYFAPGWVEDIVRRPRKVVEIYDSWPDFIVKNPRRLEHDVPPQEEW
jgi:hypothetical protein